MPISSEVSSTPVSEEEETGITSIPHDPTTNEETKSSKSKVSFELVYSLSISLEEGTGSNQLAVIGSMVGLLLLLVVIVGVALLFVL